MSSVGQLDIRARLLEAQLVGIKVHLRRPVVSRLFIGQIPAAVPKAVPFLYSLCAQAQRAAAENAVAAAQGELARPADSAALWQEFLHEILWRLLLDWPPALGLPARKAEFAAWRSKRQNHPEATEALLNGTLTELADQCLERLLKFEEAALPAALPPTQAEMMLGHWMAGNDLPAAQPPGSLLGAYLGRLAAARHAAAALRTGLPYPLAAAGNNGFAIGQALTARGILTHALKVVDERVADYRIWAPTDGHFAEATRLGALLAGRRFDSPDAARLGMEQAVLALDPCLPYSLEISHA